ncbi:hypothetical protein evm_006851 [Chilo suppressalis]|nr:hypothetical protein evm_006851 [Chilo suppressalis]
MEVSLFCESSELPRDLFLCCLEKIPRNYKRKKLPKYTQDDMAKAIQSVLKDEHTHTHTVLNHLLTDMYAEILFL